MTSCALLHLPSFGIYVNPNSENNLSAVLLWTMSGRKEHFRVHCLCQWIPDQIWSNLHRKFKDYLIWCRFLLFIFRWTWHYASLWIEGPEFWTWKEKALICGVIFFLSPPYYFLLIHQHPLIRSFPDKMPQSFCFGLVNFTGHFERKRTLFLLQRPSSNVIK